MKNPSTHASFQLFQARRRLGKIRRVILVGSGKGGVGKSFVACGLALRLSRDGYRTGILDTDLHGASVPNYLGVRPPIRSGKGGLEPELSGGVKVMSVTLLVGNNPVPMRGNEKQDLITEFFALTNWGDLDYLVVDLPPSTGDELLSAFSLFAGMSTLILVTTPSKNAVSVVSRLRRLARSEKVPVGGVVLNMAFMKKGRVRSFPFGEPHKKSLEAALDSRVIVEIPLLPDVSSRGLLSVLSGRNDVSSAFETLAARLSERR